MADCTKLKDFRRGIPFDITKNSKVT